MLDIKPGDILFVWAGGFFPEAIERITHGPSHVAMFVTPNQLEEAQYGSAAGEAALSFYLDGKTHLEVWTDKTLTDGERSEMVSFAHSLYGEKYDTPLILLELLHFEFNLPLGWYHNSDEMICSVDIDRIARHVGKAWSKVANPAPVDLLNGGVLRKRFDLTK